MRTAEQSKRLAKKVFWLVLVDRIHRECNILVNQVYLQIPLRDLLEHYGEDLLLLKQKFICGNANGIPVLASCPTLLQKLYSYSMFPNIHQIFRLVCTIPVTGCECERSVSVLHRLKTYLWSSVGQERLSGLALMHIHYGTLTKLLTYLLGSKKNYAQRYSPEQYLGFKVHSTYNNIIIMIALHWLCTIDFNSLFIDVCFLSTQTLRRIEVSNVRANAY